MLTCFWKVPTAADNRLLGALEDAHVQSTHRENLSTQALLVCATAGIHYTQSLAASILTLGGTHAPIRQAIITLRTPGIESEIPRVIQDGGRIAGWGNSFVKGKPDPIWTPVEDCLESDFNEMYEHICSITDAINQAKGKDSKAVFPNPACYTAATSIVTGMPESVASYLFVASRLTTWTELFAKASQ